MRHLQRLTLDRRTLLRGAGVAVALPHMEAMARTRPPRREDGQDDGPRRLVYTYFPNGCSLPSRDDAKYAHWRWFPSGAGREFRFTRVLEPLEPFRDRLAIYGGLSHPKSRELLGHLAGDTWLTAGDLRGGHYQNSISVDQVAARTLKAIRHNSPLSMASTLAMLRPAPASLAEALKQEYRWTWRSMERSDFIEGVRALLIDKDRNPRWRHDAPDAVPDADVAAMLESLGENELTFP